MSRPDTPDRDEDELIDEAYDAWAVVLARRECHRVVWELERESVRGRIVCDGPEDAGCRYICEQDCEQYPCPHPPVPVSYCTAVEWFQDDAAEYYDGPAVSPHDGPIDLLWTGDGYDWCYTAPAEPVSSSVDGEAVETFDAGQPIVAGDLIEDMDGAPLPHELQTDGALFQAVLRVMCPSASAHDHGDCRELTGQTMAALAPILWPLLPSNDRSAASQASRPVVPVPARVDGETDGPPERPAICVHDVRGPLRQTCCCCGTCDHLDFRVTDEAWADVVPPELDGTHVCLRCFDAMAASRGIDYAKTLTEMCFVGDAAVFHFLPDSAITVGRSS